MRVLWLDDTRDPFMRGYMVDWLRGVASDLYETYVELKGGVQIVWAQSYTEFEEEIVKEPFQMVCFDHDLGSWQTGYDAAKLMVDVYSTNGWELPDCRSQSGNPVGKSNILNYIENARKHLFT